MWIPSGPLSQWSYWLVCRRNLHELVEHEHSLQRCNITNAVVQLHQQFGLRTVNMHTHKHKDDAVTESSSSWMSAGYKLQNWIISTFFKKCFCTWGLFFFSHLSGFEPDLGRMSSAGLELVSHCFCVPCRDSHRLASIHNELTAAAPFHTFVRLFLAVHLTPHVLTLCTTVIQCRILVVVETCELLWHSHHPGTKNPDISLQGSNQCRVTHNLHVMLIKVPDLFLSLIPECATVAVYPFIYLC